MSSTPRQPRVDDFQIMLACHRRSPGPDPPTDLAYNIQRSGLSVSSAYRTYHNDGEQNMPCSFMRSLVAKYAV